MNKSCKKEIIRKLKWLQDNLPSTNLGLFRKISKELYTGDDFQSLSINIECIEQGTDTRDMTEYLTHCNVVYKKLNKLAKQYDWKLSQL